ncbi:MAG: serine/threonine-protein kinase [Planctomycetota bacterium]
MSALSEGSRVNNYLLEARIGAGSFGEVWRARHHVFDQHVAIKIPTDKSFVRNLQREGLAVHGLRHPNIVRAIDLDPYSDPPYYIMELVDGPSLRAVIDHYRATFSIGAAITILRGILQALSASHAAGLIHRDVKPPNILLACPLHQIETVAEQAVKVTDFGLGRIGGVTAQSIMQSGSMVTDDGKNVAGTIAYMSPEQRSGGEIDGRSDLYSCGIVLFEMLTGELPQGNELPSEVRSGVPKFLDGVFQRSYCRYDRRFRSATEMLEALPPKPPTAPVSASPRVLLPPKIVDRDPRRPLTCGSCRGVVNPSDTFCIHCGGSLSAANRRCSKCQSNAQAEDRFCIYCGTSLEAVSTG